MRIVACAFVYAALSAGLPAVQDAAAEPAILTRVEGIEYVGGLAARLDGAVFFSDVPAGQLLLIAAEGPPRRFTAESRGASGIHLGSDGALYACETDGRTVARWTPDGARTVIAERWDGKRFNGPKGVWVDPANGVYFTDPVYRPIEDREIDVTGVFYIPPDRAPVRLAAGDLMNPDAISGSPGGDALYVATSGDGKIWAFDIGPLAELANPRLFVERPGQGIAVDAFGRVYIAVESAVEIYAVNGQLLRRIEFPSPIHAAAITPGSGLYAAGPHAVFRTPTPGFE